ncbi:hypothetical protein [Saccharococcus thermophilus]|uniref:hypothetical protein n=1 Tax=Saccharococcus thermophilus TaxID=29396 RepID=UPI0036D26F5E
MTQILLLIQSTIDGNNTNTTTEKHVVLLHYYNRFACLFHKKLPAYTAEIHFVSALPSLLAARRLLLFFFHKHGRLIHLAIDYTIFRLFIKAML